MKALFSFLEAFEGGIQSGPNADVLLTLPWSSVIWLIYQFLLRRTWSWANLQTKLSLALRARWQVPEKVGKIAVRHYWKVISTPAVALQQVDKTNLPHSSHQLTAPNAPQPESNSAWNAEVIPHFTYKSHLTQTLSNTNYIFKKENWVKYHFPSRCLSKFFFLVVMKQHGQRQRRMGKLPCVGLREHY